MKARFFSIITLLFLSGVMSITSAQALTLTNCNSKINYPAPINSGIAFHGTAMYEILAVLNIHDRANSMSGINRNSLQYRAWYSARLGQKNLSSFRLKRNVLDHINRLKFLNIRYPSVTDLIGRKTKFYLAGYYQGIYPKTARKLRTNLHGRKIFTFINSISCKSAFDKSYKATFEDLFTDMLAIGKLTGRQKQAQDLVTQYQARLRAVANKLAGKKPKRIFYFEGGLKTPYGPRAGSIETIILEKAGAENIAITDPERPALRWATLRRENLTM